MGVLRRRKDRARADVEHQIRHELTEILPILRIERCAIELDEFEPATGTATLLFRGECPDCNASAAIFIQGIEAQLKLRVAELRVVRANLGLG